MLFGARQVHDPEASSVALCQSGLTFGNPERRVAVDLSVLGLLLTTSRLALRGASVEVLQPLRRLTLFVSVITLALNVVGDA